MIILLIKGFVWWAGAVCVIVVGKLLIICCCTVMLCLGCGVGFLVLLGFSGFFLDQQQTFCLGGGIGWGSRYLEHSSIVPHVDLVKGAKSLHVRKCGAVSG
jgi:hypothetical protein